MLYLVFCKKSFFVLRKREMQRNTKNELRALHFSDRESSMQQFKSAGKAEATGLRLGENGRISESFVKMER